MSKRCTNVRARRGRGGFTLVELLVVVAVIALLIGVLLPALAGARASGQQAQAANNIRQMLIGLTAWSTENDLLIPGINTTGSEYDGLPNTDVLDRSPVRAAQNWDWLSNSLAQDGLPNRRLPRMAALFSEYGDPTVGQELTATDLTGLESDEVEQLESELGGSITAPSYFMPMGFQYAGETIDAGGGDIRQWGAPSPEREAVSLPENWFPRLTSIGQESLKVAVADGAVRLDPSRTIDAGPFADPTQTENYGLFGMAPPTWTDSPNYAAEPGRVELAYRHNGRMNAGFFDGHLELLEPDESQEPKLWYPKGSVYEGTNTPEAVDRRYDSGDFID